MTATKKTAKKIEKKAKRKSPSPRVATAKKLASMAKPLAPDETAKKVVKKAEKSAAIPSTNEEVVVKRLTIEREIVAVKIIGTAPLIVHRWSEKAKAEIRDKQAQSATRTRRERRNPSAEYAAAFYTISGKPGAFGAKYGIPVGAIKNAIVRAGSFTDKMLPMTSIRGSVFVRNAVGVDRLVPISKHSPPYMREDAVKIGMSGTDLRYRPCFDEWEIVVECEIDKGRLSVEQLVALFDRAGFSVGLCEWRPERNGEYGTFTVA